MSDENEKRRRRRRLLLLPIIPAAVLIIMLLLTQLGTKNNFEASEIPNIVTNSTSTESEPSTEESEEISEQIFPLLTNSTSTESEPSGIQSNNDSQDESSNDTQSNNDSQDNEIRVSGPYCSLELDREVIELGSSIMATIHSDASSVTLQWIHENQLIDEVSTQSTNYTYMPSLAGEWQVNANCSNGESDSKSFWVSSNVIPESFIGILALISASFAALLLYKRSL